MKLKRILQVVLTDLPSIASVIYALVYLVISWLPSGKDLNYLELIFIVVTTMAFESIIHRTITLPKMFSKIEIPDNYLDNLLLEKELELNEIQQANTIDICGITLGGTIKEYEKTLSERLENGTRIRLLCLDDEFDEVLNQIVMRSWSDKVNIDSYKTFLKGTSEALTHISNVEKQRGTIELRKMKFIPVAGIIMIDSEHPNAKAIVEFYRHKQKGSYSIIVSKRDSPELFDDIESQFQEMWASAN